MSGVFLAGLMPWPKHSSTARYGIEPRERLGRCVGSSNEPLVGFIAFADSGSGYERRAGVHQTFLSLAWTLICWR
jgi:hypothetical protein